MPKPTHTPLRNVRVPDDVWNAAKAAAQGRGETVSEVINAALRRYIARNS